MAFNQEIVRHEGRLNSLAAEVDGGESRLEEPRRVAGQIEDLEKELREVFTDRIREREPSRGCHISDRPEVRGAWRVRHDEIADDARFLSEAKGSVEDKRQEIEDETLRLRKENKEARKIRVFDPPPPPDRRRRSFWERLILIVKRRSIRAFFDRFEIIEKTPKYHDVLVHELLSRRVPDTNLLQKILKDLMAAKEKGNRILDEVSRMAVPATPEDGAETPPETDTDSLPERRLDDVRDS